MPDISRITVFNETGIRVVTVAVPQIEMRVVTVALSNNNVSVIRVNQGLQGRNGVDGDSVGQPPPIGFAWNNVSPRVVYTMPMDGFIISVMVSIETAFNGTGASLRVGTNGNSQLLVAQTEVDPAQVADFEIGTSELLSDGTNIIVTTTPGAGASAGSGILIIKYIAA